MAYDIQQSTTQSVLLFFLVLSSDHISPATGLSPTVTISKNGAAFGSPSGAVSEIANGWYKVAGNATDTGTLGPLALHASAATADNCDIIIANIVAYNPQNSNLGLSHVSANTDQINGVSTSSVTTVNANIGETQPINFTGTAGSALVKVDVTDIAAAAVNTASAQLGVNVVSQANIDFGALQKASLNAATPASVTGAVGSVTGNVSGSVASVVAAVNVANPVRLVKNTSFSNFAFLMVLASDHVTPATGLTVTCTRSLDGGAFGASANAPTELANGVYLINLAATDTNANSIVLRFTAATADQTVIFLATNIG